MKILVTGVAGFIGSNLVKTIFRQMPIGWRGVMGFRFSNVDILQQELVRAGVLPEDYDFEAHKELVPMQPGDVPVTFADTSALEHDFGFKPSTSLRDGLRAFAEWYAGYYGKN